VNQKLNVKAALKRWQGSRRRKPKPLSAAGTQGAGSRAYQGRQGERKASQAQGEGSGPSEGGARKDKARKERDCGPRESREGEGAYAAQGCKGEDALAQGPGGAKDA